MHGNCCSLGSKVARCKKQKELRHRKKNTRNDVKDESTTTGDNGKEGGQVQEALSATKMKLRLYWKNNDDVKDERMRAQQRGSTTKKLRHRKKNSFQG